jgi:hypothetical protein
MQRAKEHEERLIKIWNQVEETIMFQKVKNYVLSKCNCTMV